MADHFLRIVLIFVLILLSGFFSGSETALFSLDQIQRRRIGLGDSSVDRALRWLLSQPRRLIATLLVGNELVNISISTVVAGLTHDVAAREDPLEQTFLSMAVAVPLVLLFGEVAPKTTAIKIPEAWSRAVARPLRWFAALVTPLRWMVRSLADLLISLLGGQPPARERPLSEDEFLRLVEQGSQKGALEEEELDIIENVFEFGDTTVGDVMTTRDRVFAISVDMPMGQVVDRVREAGYSRVPVYRDDPTHVVGILYAKDLVGYGVDPDAPGRLAEILREPLFVGSTMPCAALFKVFRDRRTHIAIVADQGGALVGLVTMQDLLDELFGELSEGERSGRDESNGGGDQGSREGAS